MKHTIRLRSFLALAGSSLMLATQSHAAWTYWDTNGNTAGLGTTAGTWGTDAFISTVSAGGGRGLVDGTIAPAAYVTTTSDTLSFGTLNLSLSGAATTVTVTSTQNIGNITFGLAQTEAMTLTGGTINFGAAGIIYALAPDTIQTIASAISGAATSLTKGGQGTLLLTGTNTYTGTTIITSGGMLQVGDGTSGSLSATNALTFDAGGGTFNVAEAAGSTEAMGTLTFSAGEGTVQSTYGGSGNTTLSFTSLAARTAGASGNFIVSGGTNGSTNKIVLTGAGTGTLLDQGLFFGGSSYAAYDGGGFVRAYGSGDTDYLAAPTGATMGSPTGSSNVELTTGNITAQDNASVNTLNLAANSLTFQDTASLLSVNGILSSGAAGGTISNGANASSIQTTASGGDLVIRVNGSGDALTINPDIVANGASSLTKSGAGTLTLAGANTYTGTTTINAGTLAVSGGSAIADAGSVVLADAAGATFKLNSSETIANLSGGGFSGGNVNVQGNTLTLNMTGDQTFGGRFSGTSGGAVTKTGNNTLTLNDANSFAGTTNLDEGSLTLAFGNSGTTLLQTISSGGAINMAGGTTLNVFPANQVALGQQNSNAVSQLTVAGAGYVISNNISVTSGTGTLVLSGNQNRLIYSGEISGGASGNQILKANSGVGSNGGSQQYVFSGLIKNGTGGSTLGVTIDATGTGAASNPHLFNFSGQNTFTGPIVAQNTINSTGGVYFVVGGERTSNGSGITIGNGYLGGGNYSNTITLATDTILNYASTATQTLGGVISGGGSLLNEGSGTLTLTAANTYTGATTVNLGTLNLGGGTATGSLDSTVLNMGGGTLDYTRTGNTTQAFTTTNIKSGASTITAVAGNTLTLGSLLKTGSGAVNFGSTGTITTSTANDASGIIGGWATFGGTAWAVANGPASAITGFAGSYTLTNPTTGAGNVAANYASNNISVDSNQSPGTITPNTILFNTAGAYTLTLSGTSTINSSGIMVNSAVGANASTITGGTIRGNNGGSLNIIQNNTNTGGELTIGSIIANNGTSGLSKSGAGTLILTATNSYTGGTFIGAGTLQLGNGGSTGALSTSGNPPIVNNGSLVVNRSGNLTLTVISGTGSVTLTNPGSGSLTLNSGNSYSGGFTLNSGNIANANSGTYGGFGTGTVTINGGTLNFAGGSPTVTYNNNMVWNSVVTLNRSSSGVPSLIFDGDITLGADSGYANAGATAAHNVTFNGNISDGGSGYGVSNSTGSVPGNGLTFNGQNTFTGGITVINNTAVTVGGSGRLGGGNYAGDISMGGNGASFTYSSSANQTLGGVISGSGSKLTKDTSSTSVLTLSNANTYTGITTVNAGTLLLATAGSTHASSAVTVNTGAALGGDGTVGGNATFNNDSIFAWNLSVDTPASTISTTVADTFTVTGTLTDGGGAGGSVFRVVLAGSQTFADNFWTANQTWSSVLTSGNSLALQTLFTSFSYENGSGTIDPTGYGSFTLTGTTLDWTAAAIPEPTSALAGLLLGAGLLRRRRK